MANEVENQALEDAEQVEEGSDENFEEVVEADETVSEEEENESVSQESESDNGVEEDTIQDEEILDEQNSSENDVEETKSENVEESESEASENDTSAPIDDEESDSSENEISSSTNNSSVVDDEFDDNNTSSSTNDVEDNENVSTTTDATNEIDGENDTSTSTNSQQETDNVDSETTSTSTDSGSNNYSDSNSGSDNNDNFNEDTESEVDINDTDTDDTDSDSNNQSTEENNSPAAEEETNPEDEIIEGGVSDIVSEVVTLTRQLVTEENYYQFSRQSCAPVGDGTFHCSMNSDPVVDTQAAVFADKDKDGDMEIFIRTSKGDVKQISDNDYDDTAPHYDAKTKQVVWQRLVDGRYQVFLYDLLSEEEKQLTFSRTNNMDPKVSDEGIVWQAWDGNDWEIMLFDGKFTDQITDNELQDVTPVIEDGYVLWSIIGGEEQEARVYSLESGEILTITGHEGGAIANPRFVLVYDTKFDNGDVVTQGFDPVTGLSAPISAKPAEAPIDIPEADPIGEIRALIQNKSNQKENEVVNVPLGSDSGSATSTASSTGDTLIINTTQSEDDVEVETSTTTTEILPEFGLTEFDLVITKEATSTSMEDIERELPNITERVATSTQE